MAGEEQKTIIECPLKYALSDESGKESASGEARAVIDEESLSLIPKYGEALYLSLRDIHGFSSGDYRIQLDLISRERVGLFHIGNRYEDFLRALTRQRNEVILTDMLMEEKLLQGGIRGRLALSGADVREKVHDEGEARFYETALVLLPDKGDLVRIPYSSIVKFGEGDYTITIECDDRGALAVSQMGSRYDLFKKCLAESVNALNLKAQALAKDLLPQANPADIRKIAHLMKEGRAARRMDIDSVSPDLWKELEKRVALFGMQEEYDFLKPISQKERTSIGFKRGLMGDLTGEYLWFLMPIYSAKPDEPGNAVVMEAASDEGSGRATYVFRIMGRGEYATVKGIEELHLQADRFMQTMNRCMIDINFRREPVYLPEEKLADPRYARYRFSIQKIPSLRFLRERYVGRIVHSSPEQWQKDIMELLRFNVTSRDDRAVWKKTEGPE